MLEVNTGLPHEHHMAEIGEENMRTAAIVLRRLNNAPCRQVSEKGYQR